MRRVIFVTNTFDEVATGPAIYGRYLWDAFKDDREYEFHVVAPTMRNQDPRLHASGQGKSSRQLYEQLSRTALDLAAGRERKTIIHSNGAHIIPGIRSYAGVLLAQINDYHVADAWRRAPHILRAYGPRRLASLFWRRQQEARTARMATRLVCNSNFTRQRVLANYRCEPDRVVTIYKAVDTSQFERPSPLPADPLPDRPRGARLVFVGNDWKRKGLLELLNALPIIASCVPNVHLVVAGPCTPVDLESLRTMAAQHGVEPKVHLAGVIPRSTLCALLWHSDVFVLPTREEALGVSILEAMAAGVPVVATRTGGIPEIVRRPEEGVLVNVQQPRELAEALTSLLQDEPRRQRLAQAGRSRATEFSVEVMVGRVRQLYDSLN